MFIRRSVKALSTISAHRTQKASLAQIRKFSANQSVNDNDISLKANGNYSFSESYVRPILKQTIRNIGYGWFEGTEHIRKTLLETLITSSDAALLQSLSANNARHSMDSSGKVEVMPELTKISEETQLSHQQSEVTTPEPAAVEDVAIHPILGKLLCDLTYKKIYLTNVKSLVHAGVWEKQRTLRPARAELIANSKVSNGTLHKLPGIIALYHNVSNGNVGIFDGQHRIAALYILANRKLWDEEERNVLVEVFEVDNQDDEERQVKQLFREINSAEPVSLIDMLEEDDEEEEEEPVSVPEAVIAPAAASETGPAVGNVEFAAQKDSTAPVTAVEATPVHASAETTDSGEATAPSPARKTSSTPRPLSPKKIRTIINETCAHFQDYYSNTPMFKPSKACKTPHMNVDKMRDELYESEILLLLDHIQSTADLIAHVERINSTLEARSDEEWLMLIGGAKPTKAKKQALNKAREHKFYLGLDKNWIQTEVPV